MKRFFLLILAANATIHASFLCKVVDGKYISVEPDVSYRVGSSGLGIPSTGRTITTSGKYIISGELNGTFAAGVTPITITASDVELDLNGFTITGPGTSTGAGDDGIYVNGATNVVIKNGSIEQIDGTGIRINNSTSIVLEDLLSRAHAVDGFNITVTGNRHCSITNCRAEGNGNDGFADAGGSTISYKNCTAFNNGADGLDLTANNHLVQECTSNENAGLGMNITGTAIDIISCHFDENTGGGVDLTDITNFCIDGCTFNRNSDTGVLMTDADNGSLARCCIIGNGGHGISVTSTSDSIAICNNMIINNTNSGIMLEVSTTQSCQITDNKVVGNGGSLTDDAYGIDIGGGRYNSSNPGAAATARTHSVFGNLAHNNGGSPAGTMDSNYSNDIILSPDDGTVNPNGLIVKRASGLGRLENVTA